MEDNVTLQLHHKGYNVMPENPGLVPSKRSSRNITILPPLLSHRENTPGRWKRSAGLFSLFTGDKSFLPLPGSLDGVEERVRGIQATVFLISKET